VLLQVTSRAQRVAGRHRLEKLQAQVHRIALARWQWPELRPVLPAVAEVAVEDFAQSQLEQLRQKPRKR
jgi:hypothetical protein